MTLLPPVYPITDRGLTGLSHAAQVERLAAGGATLVQLRDKTADDRDFIEAARAAIAVARPRGVRIIINDRIEVATAVGADGLHLGQGDLSPVVARERLGAGMLVGYSTHSLDQAEAADRLPVDYVAIGPVYRTTTKENPDPIVGPAMVARVVARLAKPVVAIGGITLDAAPELWAAGAASLAVISDLLVPAADITERLRAYLRAAAAGKTPAPPASIPFDPNPERE